MVKGIEYWINKEGTVFLKKVGIRNGQTVLDFGCRNGNYTIPAARIVGKDGLVYALDKDAYSLRTLREKVEKDIYRNIVLLETNGSLEINLEDNSLDVVLTYDVLHLIENRKALYKQIYRVLRKDGLFSVYPKHNKLDSPGWGLENMVPNDILKEIEGQDFHFEEEYCATLSHDDSLVYGCILNFRKAE
jgi:ubiquinone/menaquinone biosynthesis C-methylase UbiE